MPLMLMQQPFRYNITVHHEDIDIYGMVYHTNYLKFMERARSDLFCRQGINFHEAWQQGLGFVLSSAAIDFKKPARLHDCLQVITQINRISRVTFQFEQIIEDQQQNVLCIGQIKIACIDAHYRPRRIPEEVLSGN